MRRYDPWKDAAERHAGIHIQKAAIAPLRGAWVPSQRVILLARRLTIAETRHTLAHEIAHIDLAHARCSGPDGDRQQLRNEAAADQLAARRLVPLRDLADVLAWTDEHDEVCEALAVTSDILMARLAGLTREEYADLRGATAHHREGAA